MKNKILYSILIIFMMIALSCSLLSSDSRYDVISVTAENGMGDYEIFVSNASVDTLSEVHLIIVTDGDTRTSDVLDCAEEILDNYLVIGIGYDGNTRRVNDFTPTEAHGQESGDAAIFLDFIEEQVMPIVDSVIESRARGADVKNIIAGHSLGGLFSVYAFFESDVFDYAISLSPSLYWDNQAIFGVEAEYAASNDTLNRMLYMSIGELEADGMTANVKAMESKLEERHYTGLRTNFDYFPGEIHMSAFYPGIENALIFIRDSL